MRLSEQQHRAVPEDRQHHQLDDCGLRPSGCTQRLTTKWPLDRYETLDGKCYNKPYAEETAQRAEIYEELTEAGSNEEIYARWGEPDHEDGHEEADVTYCQNAQIYAG